MDFTKYEVTLEWPIVGDEEERQRKRKEYFNEEQTKIEQFCADLIDWYGLPDNVITRRLVSMAWEDGHSSGYSEVANCFCDYADLYAFIVKHKEELK